MPDTWRVGRHQPRNLYVGEVMVGVMVGPETEAASAAASVVRAMNTVADPAVRCIDCKRRTEKPIAVYDPQGRLVGYRGPQCYQRRGATGVQLPLEQEGADR